MKKTVEATTRKNKKKNEENPNFNKEKKITLKTENRDTLQDKFVLDPSSSDAFSDVSCMGDAKSSVQLLKTEKLENQNRLCTSTCFDPMKESICTNSRDSSTLCCTNSRESLNWKNNVYREIELLRVQLISLQSKLESQTNLHYPSNGLSTVQTQIHPPIETNTFLQLNTHHQQPNCQQQQQPNCQQQQPNPSIIIPKDPKDVNPSYVDEYSVDDKNQSSLSSSSLRISTNVLDALGSGIKEELLPNEELMLSNQNNVEIGIRRRKRHVDLADHLNFHDPTLETTSTSLTEQQHYLHSRPNPLHGLEESIECNSHNFITNPLDCLEGSDFSLEDYLWTEVFNVQDLGEAEASRHQRVQNFIQVPWKLEQFQLYGFLIAFDCFLYVFTLLPIRIVVAFISATGSILLPGRGFGGIKFRRAHLYDLMRGIILVFCSVVLCEVDMSRVYHSIRGQAMIKLYVLFTMIEIFDKLCSSLCQDTLDSLYYTSRSNNGKIGRLALDLTLALIFVLAHALLLFSQVVTINVAINSSNTSLLTLLISNNFAEIKSMTVHVAEYSVAYGTATVLLSEVFVDWVKHAFITKFNRISAESYSKFMTILARDVTGCRKDDVILDRTHLVSRRLGLVTLPLACVVVRMIWKIFLELPISFKSFLGVILLFTGFMCLVALKILVSILLTAYACKSGRSVLDGVSSPREA